MTNEAVGGTNYMSGGIGQRGVTGALGLNNIGLSVKVYGNVVDRDTSPTPTWCKLDDGSGKNLRVEYSSGGVPALDTFATVTGVVSCYKSGANLYPKILVP